MESNKSLRYYSVDYFKLFCATLIVAIHLKPLQTISDNFSNLFINTFCRIAVPFFFIVSGFFFSKKLYQNKKPLKSFLLKMITVYSVWSLIYAVRLILIEVKNARLNIAFFKELLMEYLFYGLPEHLWFCLSLMVAVIIVALLHRLHIQKGALIISALVFAAGCILVTYADRVGEYIPLIKILSSAKNHFAIFRLLIFGPSFVLLGDFVARKEKQLTDKGSMIYILLAISVALHIAEKIWNIKNNDSLVINFTLYPLILFILLTLLRNPSKGSSELSRYIRNASAFTYYSHMMFYEAVGYIIKEPLVRYIVVFVVAVGVSAALTRLNNKRINYLVM